MHKKFDHIEIEGKWQKEWQKSELYKAREDADKPKSYILDMFPYPSGAGLHVGHPKGYIATDVYSRLKRMTGHEVLHPMGWDAFGLPAENYAIKNKVHPRVAVEKNVERFKQQLEVLGFDYDWGREINTTDPSYYKWTQWAFIKMFEKGLAYESNEPINWCPGCQTGLANEDLESDGTCERCGSTVEQKPMRQWVLKIREYADRMLEDLDELDWEPHIKELQRNWIGRSEGAEIDFQLNCPALSAGQLEKVTIFTTRPDTLFGATYMVLAPEHPVLKQLMRGQTPHLRNADEVEAYVKEAMNKKEMDRLDNTKEKTGVQLEGITATNPANGEEIPVYVADYVLASYGTGAIMAVPAHDERDFAFAKKFGIEIKQTIAPNVLGIGTETPKPEVETLVRRAVNLIIEHPTDDKQFLIQKETDSSGLNYVHFVGGGIDEGETPEAAIARELLEETGFSKFRIINSVLAHSITLSYRHTKNKNQQLDNSFYYLKLEDMEQQPSEVDKGQHTIEWTDQDKVRDMITWENHAQAWDLLQDDSVFKNAGVLVNSGEFDGMNSEEAKTAITEKVGGRMTKTYRLKDWVFSRQRYWGEPIPIVHCEQCGAVPVPEDELPVALPQVEQYEPAGDGQSPLATISEWVNTTCPKCGGAGRRETNTMPQWAGSSWYYLRYMDPQNDKELVSKKNEKYWAPVDVYVGGAEHATRHLIYARFWHKFLYDIGVVSTKEPFANLHSVGLVMAEDGRKMSKRWGNVINPDDVVELVGADTLRVYEMFMGPFENAIAWSKDGLAGGRRFLERVNGLSEHFVDNEPKETTRLLHKTIKKVGEDILAFKFNTAISAMMIFVNEVEKKGISKASYASFLQLLAPFAPHITEELWRRAGNSSSIHSSEFPAYDPALTKDDQVTLGVQINGKVRGQITLSPEATEVEAMAAVESDPSLHARISGAMVKKIIYVPGRILNLVIAE